MSRRALTHLASNVLFSPATTPAVRRLPPRPSTRSLLTQTRSQSRSHPDRRRTRRGRPGGNSPRRSNRPPARSTSVMAQSMSFGSTSRKPKCATPPTAPAVPRSSASVRMSCLPAACMWMRPSPRPYSRRPKTCS